MHFCRAKILIGGDVRNSMARSEFNPVSWPEIEVLNEVHGKGSVEDIQPFVSVKQKPKDERDRLAMIYGEEAVKAVWGGRNAPDEMEMPKAELEADLTWFNPLTGRAENTGKGGKDSQPVPPPAPPSGGPVEARPAVEVVGQPMAGSPAEENDPFSEYEQPEEPEETAETESPDEPDEPKKSPARKK
jgi:hypothetical protein